MSVIRKYVLLKALLPACIEYTAQGEANIRVVKPSAIFVMRFSPSAIRIIHTNKLSVQGVQGVDVLYIPS